MGFCQANGRWLLFLFPGAVGVLEPFAGVGDFAEAVGGFGVDGLEGDAFAEGVLGVEGFAGAVFFVDDAFDVGGVVFAGGEFACGEFADGEGAVVGFADEAGVFEGLDLAFEVGVAFGGGGLGLGGCGGSGGSGGVVVGDVDFHVDVDGDGFGDVDVEGAGGEEEG